MQELGLKINKKFKVTSFNNSEKKKRKRIMFVRAVRIYFYL